MAGMRKGERDPNFSDDSADDGEGQ
jgi:hypothetical protein